MRKCNVCCVVMDEAFFYSKRYDCIACHKARDAVRPDRSGARRNDTDAARARKRRWAETNGDHVKKVARRKVRLAIQQGLIQRRADCQECGATATRSDGVTAVQAHHDDYAKPLDVRWLCAGCHSAWHRMNDAARLATPPDNAAGREGVV